MHSLHRHVPTKVQIYYKSTKHCHPREGEDPRLEFIARFKIQQPWIPVFTGMTANSHFSLCFSRYLYTFAD